MCVRGCCIPPLASVPAYGGRRGASVLSGCANVAVRNPTVIPSLAGISGMTPNCLLAIGISAIVVL